MTEAVEVVNSDSVAADTSVAPVKISEDDYPALREIQILVDNLSKYRQEMGRLFQLISNIRDEANRIEVDISNRRQSLTDKYSLGVYGGPGQWALDFEQKEFVKTSPKSPVIP